MKTRSEKQTQRKLDVRWTTVRWTPAIHFVPANGIALDCQDMTDPLLTFRRNRKRRQAPQIWVRGINIVNPNGNRPDLSSGHRSNWR